MTYQTGAFQYLICVCVLQSKICDLWFVTAQILWEAFFCVSSTLFFSDQRQNHKCLPTSAHKLVPPQMMPSSWTLRFLLIKMTTKTGDLHVDKRHLRYRHEFLKSLLKEERRLHSRKIPCVLLLMLARSPWQGSHHHDWFWWCLICISFAKVRSAVQWLHPLQHKSHPVEARSFERWPSNQRIVLALCSFGRTREGPWHRYRWFLFDALQSLNEFVFLPSPDRGGVEEWLPCQACDSLQWGNHNIQRSCWRAVPTPIWCVVQNGRSQAVLAAVGQHQDPGLLL